MGVFQIRRFLALTIKELHQLRKNKRLMIQLIVMPTVALTLFGLSLNPEVTGLRTGVVDFSRTPQSHELVDHITGVDAFHIAGWYGSAGEAERALRGLDPSITLLDASGDLADVSAMLAARPGYSPLLCATAGGHWLKPLPASNASALLGVTELGEQRWLVCGRTVEGQGLTAIYRPLMWELEPLALLPTRAMTACASRPERSLAVAVGAGGHVLRLENGQRFVEQVPSGPDFSAVCVDVLGRIWAGAAGELVRYAG